MYTQRNKYYHKIDYYKDTRIPHCFMVKIETRYVSIAGNLKLINGFSGTKAGV